MYQGYKGHTLLCITSRGNLELNLFLANGSEMLILSLHSDLKGKTLAEKSKLMGEKWRNLSTSDIERYAEGGEAFDDMETELTPDEKKGGASFGLPDGCKEM